MSGLAIAALILSTIGLTLGTFGLIHTIVSGNF